MRLALLALVILAVGCDGDAETDAGPAMTDAGPGGVDAGPPGTDAGPAGTDAGPAMGIPDPGGAMDDWGLSVIDTCCSTPASAYPVGVVTMDPGYVQGNIDPAVGVFFYVFRTGPTLTSFSWPGGPVTEFVHLHDGAGMVFGPEITPVVSTATTGTWNVMPDHVYVLELSSSMGGFF